MKIGTKFLLILIFILFGIWAINQIHYELRWDWSSINTQDVHFDKNFIFGVAGAAYQYLGSENCPNCNWSHLKIHDKAAQEFGNKAGISADFWNHLDDDIALMKEMKIKAFRFSFEWSDIEPEKGTINQEALKQYHIMFEKLQANNIMPVMTLHHFTHPIWFEKLGGFEKEENIPAFINFCQLMMREFGSQVAMWATFNEPTIYVTCGYLWNLWPPHKQELNLAGTVLKNILQAHVQAYQAMKKIKPDATIGFVHSAMQYDPYNPYNPFEQLACYYLNRIYHNVVIDFFASGNYEFKIPFLVSIKDKNEIASSTLDFFGLNYYGHVILESHMENKKDILTLAYRPFEIKTDTDLCIYPEGFWRAIKDISDELTSKLHIPIYVTENGIADARDDRRGLFIERYLYALHKAIADGYDVRGYFYWSLLDNFEWHQGYSMKFGLYEVDFKTQERKLRCGSRAYLNVIQATYK